MTSGALGAFVEQRVLETMNVAMATSRDIEEWVRKQLLKVHLAKAFSARCKNVRIRIPAKRMHRRIASS
jgi:hypothetical protein